MNKSIHLKISEINEAVIELTEKLGISGSFFKDESYVDLYRLLQVYLLDIKKREEINKIIEVKNSAIYAITEEEMKLKEFEIFLRNNVLQDTLKNNIIHYLKLKFRHLKKINLEEVASIILNYISIVSDLKEPEKLIISKVNNKNLLIKIDEEKILIHLNLINRE